MFTATNLIIQMRRTARLKKRLPMATVIDPETDPVTEPVAP